MNELVKILLCLVTCYLEKDRLWKLNFLICKLAVLIPRDYFSGDIEIISVNTWRTGPGMYYEQIVLLQINTELCSIFFIEPIQITLFISLLIY